MQQREGKSEKAYRFQITICAVNTRYVHTSLAPWYLSNAISQACGEHCEVNIVESNINVSPAEVVERIIEGDPDLIGFSCYIWNIDMIKRLVVMVKDKLPNAVIVLGGPEVSYNAEEVMEGSPQVDYIISGEGELPLTLLVQSICRKEEPRDIPGLFKRQSGVIAQVQSHTTDDVPESPYSEAYLKQLDGKIAYLETSRGCPFRCAFCLSGRVGSVRYFPIERAKQDMLKLANSGAKVIKLVDRTFNADRERAAELFNFIISRCGSEIPEGVTFHFEIAGDLIDKKTLSILTKAAPGLIQMEIGLQSFCEQTLNAIRRRTDIELLKQNIKRLVEMGNIHVHVDLICGLPHEDLLQLEDSFNTALSLRPHMLQLGFLKLLHGASMREEPEKFPCNYSSKPPYEVTSTPWLSEDDLALLHRVEEALDRLYNSGRFRRTLQYVIDCTGMSPFQLFRDFGEFLASPYGQSARNENGGIDLDKLTELVLNHFSGLSRVNRDKLRDRMACDRLATNNTGWLPPILNVEHSEKRYAKFKRIVQRLKSAPEFSGKFKCGHTPLKSEDYMVFVEYKDRDLVSGEYPLIKVPLT